MFDNVGTTRDHERNRRQLAAVGLTALIGASIADTVALTGLLWAADVLADPLPEQDLVEVILEEPELEAPPAAPAAPAIRQGERAEVASPDVPPDEPPPLDPVVAPQVAKTAGDPLGPPDGADEGDPNGKLGARGTQPGPGTAGDALGPGIRTFHHSELKIKRQVAPSYPEAAKAMNLGDVDCRVRISVDERGVPFDVSYEVCPKVFQESAKDAILQWRWFPAKIGQEPVRAQFMLVIRYKLT